MSCLRFCCRAGFLSSNVISARVIETRVLGYSQFEEICEIAVLNAVSEELVRSSLNASPLMKPFVTPDGWQLEKCVY